MSVGRVGGWNDNFKPVQQPSEEFYLFIAWLSDLAKKMQEVGEHEQKIYGIQNESWIPKFYKSQVVAGMNYEIVYACENIKWENK